MANFHCVKQMNFVQNLIKQPVFLYIRTHVWLYYLINFKKQHSIVWKIDQNTWYDFCTIVFFQACPSKALVQQIWFPRLMFRFSLSIRWYQACLIVTSHFSGSQFPPAQSSVRQRLAIFNSRPPGDSREQVSGESAGCNRQHRHSCDLSFEQACIGQTIFSSSLP